MYSLDNCIYQSIRLYNNSTAGDLGLLQICNSSRNWSAVCDYGWGCTQSIVACRQLGYANPSSESTNYSLYDIFCHCMQEWSIKYSLVQLITLVLALTLPVQALMLHYFHVIQVVPTDLDIAALPLIRLV